MEDRYSSHQLNAVVGISFLTWCLVPPIVHIATRRAWPAFDNLPRHVRSGWCNRLVSAAHASTLVAVQLRNLRYSGFWKDPLLAVSDAHFFWGAVMLGYLAYDTLHLLLTWKHSGRISFLVHHLAAMASVTLGIYGRKLAVFGMATQVAFELTTPLLHTLGCLKVAGQHRTRLYVVLSAIFFAEFFLCRIVTAAMIFTWMARCVMELPNPKPAWAWTGLALYAMLCGVNMHWFIMLCSIAKKLLQPRGPQLTASTALTELTAVQGKGELVRSFSGFLRQRPKLAGSPVFSLDHSKLAPATLQADVLPAGDALISAQH